MLALLSLVEARCGLKRLCDHHRARCVDHVMSGPTANHLTNRAQCRRVDPYYLFEHQIGESEGVQQAGASQHFHALL